MQQFTVTLPERLRFKRWNGLVREELGKYLFNLRNAYWLLFRTRGVVSQYSLTFGKMTGNARYEFTASYVKINDLAFADGITLLKKHATEAQLQFDALKYNTLQVLLRINIDKTVQIRWKANDQIRNNNLVVNGQPIAIVNDFNI